MGRLFQPQCNRIAQLSSTFMVPFHCLNYLEYDLKRVPASLTSVAFLIGKWRSEFGGKAIFPTIPAFTYGEEVDFKMITEGDRVLDVLKYEYDIMLTRIS